MIITEVIHEKCGVIEGVKIGAVRITPSTVDADSFLEQVGQTEAHSCGVPVSTAEIAARIPNIT